MHRILEVVQVYTWVCCMANWMLDTHRTEEKRVGKVKANKDLDTCTVHIDFAAGTTHENSTHFHWHTEHI